MRLRLRNSLLLCVALGGCAVGPGYHAPDNKLPDSFAARPVSDASSKKPVVEAAEWWKSLGDEELNGLIDRAIKANPQLDIALTRLQEARQQESVVIGGALPEAEASAGGGRGTGSDLTKGRADSVLRAGDSGSGLKHITQVYGFDAAWELDLFGKYRREIEAAGAETEAARAARNQVLITLIADVVHAYVDMRGLQMQQAVLEKNLNAVKQYADVMRQRYEHGITNEFDVSLADRQLATLQAQQAPLAAQLHASQYAIAALLGEFPETLAAELGKPGVIPALPQALDTGVPIDLLKNRPDIQQAERELAAATARVGVAEANLFPQVSLLGGAGYQGQGLGVSPAKNSFIWSVGPSVGMPILDFGRLDALVNIADLETHEKLMRYKQAIIGAVEDVDTASSAYAGQQDRLRNLNTALEASQKAADLASERFDRGLTDMLNVIDAQRQQFDLEQQYVMAQQAAAEQFIALYKALGSGWQHYQVIPPIRQPLPAVIAALARMAE
ncbi:MAG: efflux transporter outer membrane subunit [Pseudomonadota bacterium]|nr:efflux transporter outer membrane subunit [Pseudomonadota bacterium]